jgi:hypothetical protein
MHLRYCIRRQSHDRKNLLRPLSHTMTESRFFHLLCTCVAFVSWLATTALAADIPGFPDRIDAYDSREVAMLPRYCIYTQLFRDHVPEGNDKAEIERWTTLIGPTFNAMHHYCWGLMKTNRALLLARDQRIRNFYLDDSINEFNFVLNNASPGFILLPEVLTKKGENLIRLGRYLSGVKELEQAIAVKEDYWPPYAALSDYYKKKGDLAEARQWLEKALVFAPDATALTRRLSELRSVRPNKNLAPPASNNNK